MLTNFVMLKSALSLLALLALGDISFKQVSTALVVGVTDGHPLNDTSPSALNEPNKLGRAESFGSCSQKGKGCPKNGLCVNEKCHCKLNYQWEDNGGDNYACKLIGSAKYGCKNKTSACTEWHSNTVCNKTKCVCAEGYYENSDGYDCYSSSRTKWILIAIAVIVVVIIACICIAHSISTSNKKQQAQNAQGGTASYPQAPSGLAASAGSGAPSGSSAPVVGDAPSVPSGTMQQTASPYQGTAPQPSAGAPYPGPSGPPGPPPYPGQPDPAGYGIPQAAVYPPYAANPPPPGFAQPAAYQ